MLLTRFPAPRAAGAILAGVVLAGLALTGCSPVAVVLWTDVPELVPAVELFNASQDEHVVELVYEPEIGTALRLANPPPDLVVGRYIEDASTAAMLEPLDRLVRRELDASEFYPDLLEAGMYGGRHHLLPVAFNLPLVYFTSRVPRIGMPLVIEPEEMRARAETFNELEEERWVRLAYSPVWNPEFLYEFLRVRGFEATEGAGGLPEWSFEQVVAGVTAAREWIDLNGGVEADAAFQEKYLYDPPLQLVRRGRVAYGYGRSDVYLSLSDARRAGTDFRWLGRDSSIEVLEDVVFVGIPQGARSRTGAEAFLIDLFSAGRQVEIVESSLRKRVDVFGIAGGFSSLWRVNEIHLPEYFPELRGKIPPAGWLRFPASSPRHWGELIDAVVEPWLVREVTGIPQSRDLEASVRAWLLQQED